MEERHYEHQLKQNAGQIGELKNHHRILSILLVVVLLYMLFLVKAYCRIQYSHKGLSINEAADRTLCPHLFKEGYR